MSEVEHFIFHCNCSIISLNPFSVIKSNRTAVFTGSWWMEIVIVLLCMMAAYKAEEEREGQQCTYFCL